MNRFLQVYLVPPAVFVSVVIGGGYGTGREIVEFFTRYGLIGGLLGMALSVALFAFVLACTFEFARVFRTYEYRSFFSALLGPGWIVFEGLYVVAFLLVLGVLGSAAANILEQEFAVPFALGLASMPLLVAAVVFAGRQTVERLLTVWFVVMYAVFVGYFVRVAGHEDVALLPALRAGHADPAWWIGGLLYPTYNVAAAPALLFCTRAIDSRGEAIRSALTCAVLVMVPAALFHLTFAAGYPAVLDEPVPNYWMLRQYGGPLLLIAFIVALFGTLVQTGAGLVQGLIERIDAIVAARRDRSIGHWARAAIAIAALGSSSAFATIGIIDLIGKGYTLIGIGFTFVYLVPICTLGVVRIVRHRQALTNP